MIRIIYHNFTLYSYITMALNIPTLFNYHTTPHHSNHQQTHSHSTTTHTSTHQYSTIHHSSINQSIISHSTFTSLPSLLPQSTVPLFYTSSSHTIFSPFSTFPPHYFHLSSHLLSSSFLILFSSSHSHSSSHIFTLLTIPLTLLLSLLILISPPPPHLHLHSLPSPLRSPPARAVVHRRGVVGTAAAAALALSTRGGRG